MIYQQSHLPCTTIIYFKSSTFFRPPAPSNHRFDKQLSSMPDFTNASSSSLDLNKAQLQTMSDSTRACLRMPLCRSIDIEECSISQLQEYLTNNVFTSEDLVQCYLRRIELLNPHVRAVIETNPDALSIASQLDKERKDGHIRSPLHGIPFLAKDNIATKDKMQTTAGSAALLNTVVPRDAEIITFLREVGAILLGKANLSEFASMRASFYAEGYSSRGGQNRNPYNLAHHAGGSSSGSASSVACNMCAFAIGTETDGSIMFPADRCGVVGVKPTVGLTSTAGVIPEASSMDTVGPFARSVEDAALVLDVICKKYSELPAGEWRSYTSWLNKKEVLKGAKIGIPWKRVWENLIHGLKYPINCCPECKKKGRKIIFEYWKGDYHNFKDTKYYRKPDLAAAFRSGFSVVVQNQWLPTIKHLVNASNPTLFTERREKEIDLDMEILNKLNATFIQKAEVNRWKGLIPSLGRFGVSGNEIMYYNHYWYIIGKKA